MSNVDKIEADIRIRKNKTGEVRFYKESYPRWESDSQEFLIEGIIFMWEEGNHSCDCNRYLYFQRANGEEESEIPECGDTEFSVEVMIDGKCIYSQLA